MKYFKKIFLFFLLLIYIKTNFMQLNDELIKKIYNQNKLYFIYAYDQPTLENESIFMQFCHHDKRLCAVLDESIDNYDKLIQFIGYKSKQFFLVIDGHSNNKFILQAKNVISIFDLEKFQSKVYHKQLQPYYASQKPKHDRYIPCRSLSGLQVKSFLQQLGMKVLYLYSDTKKCQLCGQMLRYYADTAQNFYKKNVMSFGYINVDLNDHPLIKTKKTPSFLLFQSVSQLPQSFSGDQYEKMQQRIQKLIQKYTGQVKSLTRHQYTKFLQDLQDI